MKLLKNIKFSIYYLLLIYNSLISLLFLLTNNKPGIFYFIFSLFIFFIILKRSSENILFFIRNFFLGIIGFLAFAIKLIDKNSYFGFHIKDSQTFEIANLMFLMTNIALCGSELGFLLSSKFKLNFIKKDFIILENKKLFFLIFSILLVISTFVAMSRKTIFVASYGQNKNFDLPINNWNSIINILYFYLVSMFFKLRNIFHKNSKNMLILLVFFTIYLIIFVELLRGMRMEAIHIILGILILRYIYKNKKPKLSFKLIITLFIVFIIMQIIGIVRNLLMYIDFNDILNIIIFNMKNILYSNKNNIYFYQGTLNDIATTFSGIIYLIKNHLIDYYYGKSYLEYILRIPPKFLYPDRPKDLSWIFFEYGFTSGGGFFELAEAYLNFGILGCFIVPLLISFIIGLSYYNFVKEPYSLFNSILFFSFLAVYIRGILYQTFAFYKSIITGLVLLIFIYILFAITKVKKISLLKDNK